MIDFHAHILPEIDDGSCSDEDTLKMIEEAQEVGFTDIIATSHYIEDVYETDEEKRLELINEIKKKNKKINISIGNEVYITNNIVGLIKEKKVSTINNSRYVLMELPLRNNDMYFNSIIDDLKRSGYVPILAHPERYEIVKNNPKIIEEWIKKGIYMQCNYLSISGKYGKEAQKTLELLLKHNLVHFLGSDAHRPYTTYPYIKEAIEKIKKITGEENFLRLSEGNPRKVLDNEIVEFPKTTEIKITFFKKFA